MPQQIRLESIKRFQQTTQTFVKAANPRKTVSNISVAQKTGNSFKTLTLSGFEVSQSNFLKTHQRSNVGKYDKKQTGKNWLAHMSQLMD